MKRFQAKPRSPRSMLLASTLPALGLVACACHAEDLASTSASRTTTAQAHPPSLALLPATLVVTAAGPSAAVPMQDYAVMPAPAQLWRGSSSLAPVTEPPNPFAQLRFRDQQPLVNRLRRLQALPFVTLWDSRSATVYVGVNRDGETGLHLRQKRDDRGSRVSNSMLRAEDSRPLPRQQSKSRAR